MTAPEVRLARRWFWTLLVTAILAMGVLYEAISMPPGPPAAVLVLLSGLVLIGSTVQGARVLSALNGPVRLSGRRGIPMTRRSR